jgi:hypothetical protein
MTLGNAATAGMRLRDGWASSRTQLEDPIG